jgi:hypothetical protein
MRQTAVQWKSHRGNGADNLFDWHRSCIHRQQPFRLAAAMLLAAGLMTALVASALIDAAPPSRASAPWLLGAVVIVLGAVGLMLGWRGRRR